jgi:hypothetical protein
MISQTYQISNLSKKVELPSMNTSAAQLNDSDPILIEQRFIGFPSYCPRLTHWPFRFTSIFVVGWISHTDAR